jgi:molybdopterin-guanine dinucleotide biosynthesis protein A
MRHRVLAGIFVGGSSTHMGGTPKGLLRLPNDESIVDRWLRLLGELGIEGVLVGSRAEYAPRPMLADDVEGTGPLGGLVSLLRRALLRTENEREPGPAWVLAVACDMPHVSSALVARLADAPYAVAITPRRDGRREPMFARYDARHALATAEARAARGELSMQGLLEELVATDLSLSSIEANELDDWDTLEDVQRRPV